MAARPPAPPADRSSTTTVFKDGLGTRVRVTDAGGDVVEHLQLASDIAAQESAIRDRVGRLVNFRHARYVRLRGVDRAKTGTKPLFVAYDALDGHRLSSVLETLPKVALSIEVDIALQIVRDLLPAVGILHDSRKVTHGAIALERLVYTSQQRLVIVDHGLGAALARMNQPRKKLWDQFRIASPSSGRALFDEKMDVVQIGLVALSLLLGRPLTDDEYPAQVKRLIFSVKEVSSRIGSRPIGPELRRWLERATGIDEAQTFNTIKEAQDAFETVVAVDRYAPAAAAVKAFFIRYEELLARLPKPAPVEDDAPAEKPEKKAPGAAIDVDSALSEMQMTVTIAPRRRTPAASADGELAPPAAAEAVELKPPPKARGRAAAEPPADAVAEARSEAAAAGARGGRRKTDGLDALQTLQAEMARSGDVSALEQTANAVYEDAAGRVTARTPADDGERAAREAAERARQEAEVREQAEREGRALAEQVARTAAEQAAREAAERAAAERQARAASEREAVERGARQEAERQAHEASLRATREAADREVAEQAAREAAERADRATREAAERAERAEREAGERVERVEREAVERAERVAREAAEQAAAERAIREQEARERERQVAAEREAAVEKARREAREAAERAAKEAADRAAAERAALEAAARAEREAAERDAAQRAAREAAERAEREAAERAAAQQAAREAAERAEREAAERAAAERALRDAAERAERAERAAVEAAARAEREAAERAERIHREAVAREAAERQAREQAEREAKAAADRAAKEAAERAAAERAAREAAERAERAEREAAERADRVAREAAERAARAEREAAEREAAHVAAREAAERAVLEAAEREAAHRAALEAAERAVREAAERAEAERAARELAEQAAREAAQRALADLASQHAGTRTEMEAASRLAAERAARDAAEAAEAARLAREEAERHAEERAAAQQAAREAAERAEREAAERAAAERAAREHAARAEAEREARAAAELEARRAAERAERHAAERHAAEQAAREAAALMEAERQARAAAEARAREAAEQAAREAASREAAERAAREAAADGDGRRRRRKKRFGQRTAAEVSAVEPQPSVDEDIALATATTFAAPMPAPSAPTPAASSDEPLAGVVPWQPGQAVDVVPAWARGSAADPTPSSDAAPEPEPAACTPSGASTPVEVPPSAPAASAGPATGSPSASAPSILPFPPKADTWMHRAPQVDPSIAAAEDDQERDPEIVAAPRRRFSVNWARTLAASLLVALLEGVAFATAWWYVTPEQEGWLVVHTKPAGIQVSVDGMVLGKTPFAKALAPGRHTIELRYGTGTRVVPVEISAGVQTEQRLTWGNGFTTGQASITSTPKGSEVAIDGRVLGKTPLVVSDLLPGKHEVTIASESGSVTQMLMIEAGQTTELDVPVYAGWVSVLSPVQLQITLGGRLIGTTEIEKLLLKPGHHTLGLANESLGYRGSVEVRVRPGATSSVSVVPKTAVQVEAPEGTELSVNGESMGTLPNANLEVPLGTAEFVMRYKDEERRVVTPVTMLSPVVVRFDAAPAVEQPESR